MIRTSIVLGLMFSLSAFAVEGSWVGEGRTTVGREISKCEAVTVNVTRAEGKLILGYNFTCGEEAYEHECVTDVDDLGVISHEGQPIGIITPFALHISKVSADYSGSVDITSTFHHANFHSTHVKDNVVTTRHAFLTVDQEDENE